MKSKIDWIALFFTVLLIVIAREGAVALMTLFGHPELGNLIGLALLLFILVIWRRFKPIPHRMIDANAWIMKESAFAFLPISAGAVIMLVAMGAEIPAFLLVMVVSTLIPLWVYAKISKRWL